MNPSPLSSRVLYNRALDDMMKWLLRDEMHRPVDINRLLITTPLGGKQQFEARLEGPAAKHMDRLKDPTFRACGEVVPPQALSFRHISQQLVIVTGQLKQITKPGSICKLQITGTHPAVGAIDLSSFSKVPERLEDSKINGSSSKLRELQELTGAKMLHYIDDPKYLVQNHLEKLLGTELQRAGLKTKERLDYYWFLESLWVWLLLPFLVAEVVVRKWHEIFPG